MANCSNSTVSFFAPVKNYVRGDYLPSTLRSLVNSPLFILTGKVFETAAVTVAVVIAIRFASGASAARLRWFTTPCILVAAAYLMASLKKVKFELINFKPHRILQSLKLLGICSALIFPAVFIALLLMQRFIGVIPLQQTIGNHQQLLTWLVYQFFYIAVAEEVFFRGYVQSSIFSLKDKFAGGRRFIVFMSVFLSAFYFAAAHFVVQGNLFSLLTFMPGLVLGWLFIRTKSLMAPILFHALANIFYLFAASAIA
jgi:membrane protease YdiL (CAAX protease family)